MSKPTIAERLIQARGRTTRKTVAEAVGISYSALAMYELGLRIPKDPIKQRLAAHYETSVQDLFY